MTAVGSFATGGPQGAARGERAGHEVSVLRGWGAALLACALLVGAVACEGERSQTSVPASREDGGVSPDPSDAGVASDAGDLSSEDVGRGSGPEDLGTTDLGSPDLASPDPDLGPPDESDEFVVVTLNTHSFQEGDDSLQKLAQIGEGLAALDADLIGLNEVMSGTFWAYDYGGAEYDGAERIRGALEAASGTTYHLHRQVFAHWADGEAMANVLLSRFPLLETGWAPLTTTDFWPGPQEQRCVVYARVDVPRLGLVNVFVTHTGGFDSADTEVQIGEVKAYMADRFREDEALDLLLGDLNTPSTWPHYTTWLESPPFRLIDTYAAANPDGFSDPTMAAGEHRIDYVFAGEGWGLSEDPSHYRSVRVFTGEEVGGALLPVVSDHFGVMTVFSL